MTELTKVLKTAAYTHAVEILTTLEKGRKRFKEIEEEADLNPNYAPDEPAVEAAYLKDIEKWVAAEYEATKEVPEVSVQSLQEAAETGGLKTYTYPEARLRMVQGG